MSTNRMMTKRILHCAYCARPFKFPSDLKRHEMTHTGEKAHVCAVCGTGSIMYSSIVSHLKKHHPREMAAMIAKFGSIVSKVSDQRLPLAKSVCRNNVNDRDLEDDVFHDGIVERKPGKKMRKYVVSQEYLQDVTNNNVDDDETGAIHDETLDDNSLVIFNDDGSYIVVNADNGNEGNVSTGERNVDDKGYRKDVPNDPEVRLSSNKRDSPMAFPPEVPPSPSPTSMSALPPPSCGAPPCFDLMQRDIGPLRGDSLTGHFSWTSALWTQSESFLASSPINSARGAASNAFSQVAPSFPSVSL